MKKDRKDSYLKRTELSGYKSIVKTDIDFEDGLNIIIGKNATGKTNFLSFLNKALENSFGSMFNFSSTIEFHNENKVVVKAFNLLNKEELINKHQYKTKGVENEVLVNGRPDSDGSSGEAIRSVMERNNLFFTSRFIQHGVPENYPVIETPFSFIIDKTGVPDIFLEIITKSNIPDFIKKLFMDLTISEVWEMNNMNADSLSSHLKQVLNDLSELKKFLAGFTPVSDIRLSENFSVSYDDEKEVYSVNNLLYEFKVQDRWHPYNNLSDGTKRLFYVISEIVFSDYYHFSSDGFGKYDEGLKSIILIEEPELTVHPHQLMQLMNFLKEMSNEKQIILTTHSPEVLDVLNKEELKKIIIAYTESSKEGTKLRHLDVGEIDKASAYMEEDYLSDYWKYSDLEK